MNLTLHLTPETESRLRAQAAQSGKSLETLALEAIEDILADGDESSRMLPYEVWKAKFDHLISSMPRGNPTADLSRESIYQGRGE
jgi:hypothetical protein